MQRSTKLHLVAVIIAAVGFGLFAVPLWIVRETPHAGAFVLVGLTLMFVGVLSGLGLGPLGRARNRAGVDEDAADRRVPR